MVKRNEVVVLGSVSAGNHGFSVSGDYWSGYVEEVQVIRCHRHCTYEETGLVASLLQ